MHKRIDMTGLFMVLTWICLSWVSAALAQNHGQQPNLPLGGGGRQMPAPASGDTVVADLAWGLDHQRLRTIWVTPDSLLLGDVLTVAVDVPSGHEDWPDSLLMAKQPWLEAVPTDGDAIGVGIIDPASGTTPVGNMPPIPPGHVRLWRQFRVYQLDPFKVRIQDLSSRVITVQRRISDQDSMAPVRDPRPLGWSPASWVVGLVLVLVLLLLLWAFWRRRKKVEFQLPDRPLPLPAWLEAICRLEALWKSGCLERGEGRLFLDRLAGLTRIYLADRFGIGAKEMTAQEIVTACRDCAWDVEPVGSLATLMDACDRWRYQPMEPNSRDCRVAAWTFFRAMGTVRIMPEFTPVPADLTLQASGAWAYMGQELDGVLPAESPLNSGEGA